MTTVYVLQLSNGKFYVGKSNDVHGRFQQHLEGIGSAWTNKYPPVLIKETRSNVSPFDEDKITKEYMAKYGIENVRGGSYAEIELNAGQINMLNREIRGAKDLCIRCGRSGHFIKDCYATRDVSGKVIESEEEEEEEKEEEEEEEDNIQTCYRCERQGHFARDCYAKRDIYGNYL